MNTPTNSDALPPMAGSALRGNIDSHGWWKPPVTPCCKEMYVHLDRSTGIYRKWHGYEKDEIPPELHCNRCNKTYRQNEKKKKARPRAQPSDTMVKPQNRKWMERMESIVDDMREAEEKVETPSDVTACSASSRRDELLKLPLSVRKTWLKVMGAIPHMTPATTPGAAKKYADENKITDAERDEFRRYFPNGFFGRIELNPPQNSPVQPPQ